ncbi:MULTISPECIES: hypothetical protein [unclassified Streptomyces]|uniref:hypothetical protein n=1 Tax=unclassified Streptomyces TaxID=2593676 RepID=UPI000477D2AB|nr:MULTISPECIES: hypothetical protein [unclassified Streptomyces]
MQRVRELGEPEAELRDHFEEIEVARPFRRRFRAESLQSGKGLPALVLQCVEAFPDASAEFGGSFGIAVTLVRARKLVEEELLAAGEAVRLVLEALDVV